MSIDSITRQPILGIYWIICFFISNLISNKYSKFLPLIKKLIVLVFLFCMISGLIFILPNYTNSYMQQHFLNGAHNFKFGLYNFNDMHSGFYGPLTYWLFTWWRSDIPFSIAFAKLFVFIFFPLNSLIIIKLMPKTSNYLRLSVIFLVVAQAYYFYLGVHQFIVFFTLLLFTFGYKKGRDGTTEDKSFQLINVIIVSISTICLFLLKPHLIIYGLLTFPLLFKFKKNKNWLKFISIRFFNFSSYLITLSILLILSEIFFNFRISNYFEFMSIPSGHGIKYGYLFALTIINILLIYSHWFVRSKIEESTSKNLFFIFPIILTSLALIYASSKHGSDLSHILPLWTIIIADILDTIFLIKNTKRILKEFNFIKVLLISFPLFLLPLTVESYGSTYKWYLKIDSDSIKKEIQYIKEKYNCQGEKIIKSNFKSCVSFGMGYGSDSLSKIMYLSPLITNKFNYNLVDISMIRDKYDSGYLPYYQDILSGKQVSYFIIPKGEEPFSMGVDIFSGDEIEPMVGRDGVIYFRSNYEIIETTDLYDIYSSKYN